MFIEPKHRWRRPSSNLTRSRGELEKARGQLATAVGLPVNNTLKVQTLGGPPQVRELTASVAEFLDRARAARPDLVAAEAQARAARATAEAASKAGLPTVEIAATAGRMFFTDDRVPASNYSLGFNVRFPIFNGFRDRYQHRLAEAQAEQASREPRYALQADRARRVAGLLRRADCGVGRRHDRIAGEISRADGAGDVRPL